LPSLWKVWLYRSGACVGGGLFLFYLWNSWQAFTYHQTLIKELDKLVLAWSLIVLAFGCQMLAWAYLMRGLGVTMTWQQVFEGYILSLLPRYIPGGIWSYVNRGEWLQHRLSVPYTISHLGSFIEIVVGITTAGGAIGIYMASQLPVLGAWIWISVIIIWFLGLGILYQRLSKLGWARYLDIHYDSARVPFRYWLIIVSLYVILWGCYGSLILLVNEAFTVSLHTNLLGATFLFSFSWLVGFFVVFVPAGLGIRETILVILLEKQLGTNSELASIIAITSRFVIALGELAWLGSWILCRRANVFMPGEK
jgi:uncharacterized membrane protein YbhN (UPF0104 family)